MIIFPISLKIYVFSAKGNRYEEYGDNSGFIRNSSKPVKPKASEDFLKDFLSKLDKRNTNFDFYRDFGREEFELLRIASKVVLKKHAGLIGILLGENTLINKGKEKVDVPEKGFIYQGIQQVKFLPKKILLGE